MAKKYRVVSSASTHPSAAVADVIAALGRMKISEAHANLLLTKKIIIKKELDYSKALELQERFAKTGLLVNIQAYESEPLPEIQQEHKKSEQDVFALLEDAFSTPFRAIKVSGSYKLSLLLVVIASLVGPLIYFGVLSGSVWALWWYFHEGHQHWFGHFHLGGRGGLFWQLLTYAVPAFVGAILILFLIYPLWPQGKRPKPFMLDRKKNKRLYLAIDQMAHAIGVPAPQYIELIPDVNAAAGPVNGLLSLQQGKLRLVIGLSLVAGSTVQQLFGVIAHEFGHFAQRSAMTTNLCVNYVNRWLGECAFGQDEWHERLARWEQTYDNGLSQTCIFCAQIMILAVRHLFAHLYKLNIYLTSSMSRNMEFDADCYETQLIGSHHVKANTLNIRKLSYAWQDAMALNFRALHEDDKLLRNIPAAIMHVFKGFAPDMSKRIEEDLHDGQTNFWDSHPPDHERIAAAEASKEPGRLLCDVPATALFNDFDTLSEQVTNYFYYRHGISGAKEFIVDNHVVLAKH
jgi:Zn-dependent protease with chaperone function